MLAKQALRRPVALGAARACSSSATSGRPGARAEEMEKAADKVQSGKNAWQKTVGGIVDAIRPITSALAPTIMPILDAPYQRGVRNAVNIDDLQAVAERRAHAMVYGYLAGGADAERSLRRSVAAFNDVELRHAVLHGVGHNDMDMRTTILGHEAQLPFFVTSCAGQRMFHADGEVATAKAAKKHGCFMALSQLTTSTFEDVREAHPDGAKCLQLYVWRDRVLLKEVRAAQFCAIRARNSGTPPPHIPTPRSPPAPPPLSPGARPREGGGLHLARPHRRLLLGRQPRARDEDGVHGAAVVLGAPVHRRDQVARVDVRLHEPRAVRLQGRAGRRLPRGEPRRLYRRTDEARV